MNKSLLIFSLFFIFSLSFVNAALPLPTQGPFEQNQEVLLTQTCGTCTYNNITSITYPNSTEAITNVAMSKAGTKYTHLFAASFTNPLGEYNVNGEGDPNGVVQIWSFTFKITPNGKIIETPESLLYILLSFFVFGLFMLSLYFSLTIPYSNEINKGGMVIKVTKLKYVKLGFVMMNYLLLVWTLNLLIGVSNNYVNLGIFFGFFGFLFDTLNYLAWPFSIFILVLMFFEIFRDANIQENIKKFGSA